MSAICCLLGIFFYATVAVVCCVFCTAIFGKYCFVVIGYDLFYIWHTSVA